MIWRALHTAVVIHWASLLIASVAEVFRHGDMPRPAALTGHFETSFVLYMTAALLLTVVSALRALWREE